MKGKLVQVTIGVDVGGTKIAAGVVDDTGQIGARLRRPTPTAVPELTEAIAECVQSLVDQVGVPVTAAAVGVAAAGFIDAERASVRFAPNIEWRDYPLAQELTGLLGVGVTIENDANAAAWAEFRFGAGREVDDMVLLTVGTGVGGGIVQAGRLVRGGYGMAAELGHVRMVRQGRQCGCGLKGCLEMYASGRALMRAAHELIATDPVLGAGLLELAGGSADGLQGGMITEAGLAGDPGAVQLLAELGSWLGEGIADICSVLDPTMVVIGGGVAEAGDLLVEPARAAYLAHLSGGGNRPLLSIRPALLGNDAGIIGAADLAIRP